MELSCDSSSLHYIRIKHEPIPAPMFYRKNKISCFLKCSISGGCPDFWGVGRVDYLFYFSKLVYYHSHFWFYSIKMGCHQESLILGFSPLNFPKRAHKTSSSEWSKQAPFGEPCPIINLDPCHVKLYKSKRISWNILRNVLVANAIPQILVLK